MSKSSALIQSPDDNNRFSCYIFDYFIRFRQNNEIQHFSKKYVLKLIIDLHNKSIDPVKFRVVNVSFGGKKANYTFQLVGHAKKFPAKHHIDVFPNEECRCVVDIKLKKRTAATAACRKLLEIIVVEDGVFDFVSIADCVVDFSCVLNTEESPNPEPNKRQWRHLFYWTFGSMLYVTVLTFLWILPYLEIISIVPMLPGPGLPPSSVLASSSYSADLDTSPHWSKVVRARGIDCISITAVDIFRLIDQKNAAVNGNSDLSAGVELFNRAFTLLRVAAIGFGGHLVAGLLVLLCVMCDSEIKPTRPFRQSCELLALVVCVVVLIMICVSSRLLTSNNDLTTVFGPEVWSSLFPDYILQLTNNRTFPAALRTVVALLLVLISWVASRVCGMSDGEQKEEKRKKLEVFPQEPQRLQERIEFRRASVFRAVGIRENTQGK